MCQAVAFAESIEIAHFLDQIGCQDQRGETWQLLANPSVHILDAIARAQQGVQSGRQWEIGQCGDVVIGKVDGILWPSNAEVFYGWDLVACVGAMPK